MTKRTDTFDLILNRLAAASETNPKLEPAFDDLHTCAPRFREAVAAIMFARKDGLAAASYDGPSVTVGGKGASTVERLAGTVDRTGATRDLAALDDALRKLAAQTAHPHTRERWICTHARTLWRITQAWNAADPTERQKRDAEAVRRGAEDIGCEHHAKAGIFQPSRPGLTDVAGNLPLPMRLCDQCWWQVKRKGKLPTGEWMQERNRTGKDELERVI